MLVDSKLLNLRKIFLREIIFYIVCAGESDIDKRKFCRYVRRNLFQKSSIIKGWGENLVDSNPSKKKHT
jgi:hypothetical protein